MADLKASSDSLPLPQGGPRPLASRAQRLKAYMMEEVDGDQSTAPLAAYSFMTGYIDAVAFSAIFVWCGFQTGNFIQLAVALARLFERGADKAFHLPDRQALASLIAFNAGAFIGRLGDWIGPKKRLWLVFGTFLQTLFLMGASIVLWTSGQGSIASDRGAPAWTNLRAYVGLVFMSASLGLQGIQAKRLNTQFGTSIVLTTIWVELMSDPKLFNIRESVRTRDHRLLAAGALFFGGFVSRSILAEIGAAGALGVGTGIRFLIALSWMFVPGK
ncbi:hypothetical protein BD626DRAFT_490277 [Schizophyllum amplum]|uniref:DUF1275 domain protein n=1 Tax=Schizophyllum amplum TaxID=97359 RepID=A0A550CJF7_9AGAR|nr:hypothetical protein BD626DRAFT_490277 [Auriculariopsis ampla]